jgi:putative IMPACT (imprinted ancient) family translation regulator
LYERVKRLLEQYEAEIDQEDFAAQVTLKLTVPRPNLKPLAADLAELSSGQIQLER